MRKLIILALAVGCLGVVASVAMAATRSVKVGDNYYVRPSGVQTSGPTVASGAAAACPPSTPGAAPATPPPAPPARRPGGRR